MSSDSSRDLTDINQLTDSEVIELAEIIHSSELQKKVVDDASPQAFIIWDKSKQKRVLERVEAISHEVDSSMGDPKFM